MFDFKSITYGIEFLTNIDKDLGFDPYDINNYLG